MKLTEIHRSENMPNEMVGLPGRTIIAENNGIEKFHITDSFDLERVAKYEGYAYSFYVNAATGDVAAVITGGSSWSLDSRDMAVLRPTKSGRFKLTDRFRLPGKELHSVLQTDTGHVFIGWKGGLSVGRIPKE